MSFHYNTFSIVLLVSGVGASLLSILIFQRLGGAVRWFGLVMLCIATWAIAYGFELASHTLKQMLLMIDLEYIGISFLPTAWIIFMIRFIGKDEWLTLRNRIILFSFPVITLSLVLTNAWHHFYYQTVSLDNTGPFPLLNIERGPWYHVHTVYFYFMLAWGVFLLVNKFRKADDVFKKQNRVILIGAFIPWFVNFLYLLGIRPYQHIDLTPYAFILTSGVIGIGLLRFKLFDIVPLARSKVVEAMNDGVLVLDGQARVIDINSAMREFLPGDEADPIGKNIKEIFLHQEALIGAVNDKVIDKLDVRLEDKKEVRFFEVAITSLFDKNTVYSGTLLIFRDITERKRDEEKLKEQAEELWELNKLKDRLFSIISHDLRSPLAGLVSILNVSDEGEISETEFRSYIQVLSKNVGYTSALLENLLWWSKSQLKGEVINPENFDLKPVIENEMVLFERKAAEKNIHMEDKVLENTYLHADVNMIRLVLRNLISNAIKFCDDGDKIMITAEAADDFTTVCVSDTGVGMNAETVQHIFNSGTTTHGTHNEKGTGLGLRLCKDFIEKNQGKIWVESEEGRGSSFCFKLKTGSSALKAEQLIGNTPDNTKIG